MEINYSNIINSILKDKILSLEEKLMLITLKNLDKYGDNIVNIGYEVLMGSLSTPRKAKVSNILKSLKDKEYIEVKRNGRRENQYRFIKDYLITEIGYVENLEQYSSKNGTSKSVYSTENRTFNKDSGYNNEILEEFGSPIDGTIEFGNSFNNGTTERNRGSEIETIKNNRSSENETIKNNGSSINRTFAYDASSKFGTIIEDYGSKNETTSSYNINNNNIYNNINYINNNKIKVFNEIVEFWNSKNINQIAEINDRIVEIIYKAITVYGVEKIKRGIENYSRVFYSNYYYNFEWQLSSFLLKPNGISRFLDDGDIWTKYKKQYGNINDQFEEYGINYEDYINNI